MTVENPGFFEKSLNQEIEVSEVVICRGNPVPVEVILGLGCPSAGEILEQCLKMEPELEGVREKIDAILFQLIPNLGQPLRSVALNLKRKVKNGFEPIHESLTALQEKLSPENLRIMNEWVSLSGKYKELTSLLQVRFESDFASARKNLVGALRDEAVQEGIFFSSSSLYLAMARYLESVSPDGANLTKSQRQFERNVFKHLCRAATKTTPRGLLTGVCAKPLDNAEATKRLDDKRAPNQVISALRHFHLTLCLPIVRELARKISERDQTAAAVVPRINTTWYKAGGKVFFAVPPEEGTQEILALPMNPILDTLLELAAQRKLRARALIEETHRRHGDEYKLDEIEDYYFNLCRKGLLIGHLEIPFEIRDGLSFLLKWLSEASRDMPALTPIAENWKKEVMTLADLMARIGKIPSPLESRLRQWDELKAHLQRLLPGLRKFDLENPFILDSVVNFDEWSFGRDLHEKLLESVGLLFRLLRASRPPAAETAVAQNYLKKLNIPDEDWSNGELPLWKVVHHFGPGKNKATAEGLSINNDTGNGPAKESGSQEKQEEMAGCSRDYKNLVREWFVNQEKLEKKILHLEEDGLAGLLGTLPLQEMPKPGYGALSLKFMIGRDSQSGSEYYVIQESNAFFNNLRFTDLLGDTAYTRQVNEFIHWMASQLEPGTVAADTLRITNTRVDSAAIYPLLDDYCLELYGARSQKAADKVIPLHEIWIRKEPAGDLQLLWKSREGVKNLRAFYRLILTDKRSSPASKFLKMMGAQEGASHYYAVSLKHYFPKLKHLPRLMYKNFVLARESWRVTREEMSLNISEDPAESFLKWNRWRTRLGMPRFIFLEKSYFDFWSPFSISSLNSLVNDFKDEVMISEMLPVPDDFWIASGNRRHHAVEFSASVRWSTK